MRQPIRALCVAATVFAGLPGAFSQIPTKTADPRHLIPIEEFARDPVISAAVVSPDGRKIASIESVDGRMAIVVADIDGTNRSVRHRDSVRSIDNVAWVPSGRWLYFLHDRGGDEGYHLFRLDSAGDTPPTDLTPFPGVSVELIKNPGSNSDALLVTLNRRNPEYPDAYRIDIAAGLLTEVVRNPDKFTEFFADRSDEIVAATSIEANGTLVLHALGNDGSWSPVYRAGPDEQFQVLGTDDVADHLLVKSNRRRTKDHVLSLDLKTGLVSMKSRHRCGRFDAGAAVLDHQGIAAMTCVTVKAEVHSVRSDIALAVAAVRKSVGKDHSLWIESISRDTSAVVFYANASDDPGQFLVWSREKGSRTFAKLRPWLPTDGLARSTHRWIKARDGLNLSTYITLPREANVPPPAVVAIHGGPWTRDSGGFETETQLLASRGYAVIQVNFRGSTGLGKLVLEAGVGQFGMAMSDDIDDVVTHLVSTGLIDGERVCLLGGSYGGYAVLRGLTRGKLRYRCGVDYAGPANLVTLMESFPASWRPYLPRSWYRFVGDPAIASQRAAMIDRSPVFRADQITVPLLIFQGANDPRVTQPQSDSIVCSARKRAVDVTYLLADNEGHSFTNEETRLAVDHGVEQFLGQHLGGLVQATTSADTLAAYNRMIEKGLTLAKCAPIQQ